MRIIESTEDYQLLRRFVRENSQEAFSRLVERHFRFVYSVCQREVGDTSLAEDVTQAVFLILAQKASTIGEGTLMAGWLFKAARFASRNALRQEARRRLREERMIAEMMHRAEQEDNSEATWQEIKPLLHDGIAALGAKDREAVLLRYFENKSFKEVGQVLGISESAAQMRAMRGIEKLRDYLKKHGVAIPSAVLIGLLLEQAVQAAPATCMAAVAGIVAKVGVAGAGAASAGLMGSKAAVISQGVIKAMFMNQVKVAVAVVGLSLVGAGGGMLAVQQSYAGSPNQSTSMGSTTDDADTDTEKASPREMLKQVLDQYKGLSSFSMRIEHQDSSGLSYGKYTQTLQWRKGGRFELLVISNNEKGNVPDYYSNGEQVVIVLPDGNEDTRSIIPNPNSPPSWEVTAGPIFSALQNTENDSMLFNPPQGAQVRWKLGPRTQWHGHAVREIMAELTMEKHILPNSFFISEDGKSLVGGEASLNGKLGWVLYSDQKMNPDLPTTLGNTRPTQEDSEKVNKTSLNNLKQLALAAIQYCVDHNNTYPNLDNPESAKKALSPLLPAYIFVHPATKEPYQTNPNLSGKSMSSVTDPRRVVLFYEASAAEDGTRGASFVDGHAERIPESKWPEIKKASGIS